MICSLFHVFVGVPHTACDSPSNIISTSTTVLYLDPFPPLPRRKRKKKTNTMQEIKKRKEFSEAVCVMMAASSSGAGLECDSNADCVSIDPWPESGWKRDRERGTERGIRTGGKS